MVKISLLATPLLVTAPALAVGPGFLLLDKPAAATSTYVTAISDDGSTIVGRTSYTGREVVAIWNAAGVVSEIIDPGTASNFALGVSADGSTVVGQYEPTAGVTRGFRWTAAGGVETLLPMTGGTETIAFDVTADGTTVVGTSISPILGNPFPNPAVWSGSTMPTRLYNPGFLVGAGVTAVNPAGTVFGGAQGSLSGGQAFRIEAGTVTLLPRPAGTTLATVTGMSDDGSVLVGVAGNDLNNPLNGRGFTWTAAGGTVVFQPLAGDTASAILDTSADGRTWVGVSGDITSATGRGVFQAPGFDRLVANDLLASLNLDDANVTGITAVSADGRRLTGQAIDSLGVERSFVFDLPIPGDANFDDKVDLLDFNRLATNFGRAGNWPEADFNLDGQIDLRDFNVLASNFGRNGWDFAGPTADIAHLAAALVPIPEPTSLTLLACGTLTLLRRRR